MAGKYDSDIHHRQSVRLKGYDYSQEGAYFVTICTRERDCLFGDMSDGEMRLNQYGLIIREEWLRTAALREDVEVDIYTIMPNHLHGIIVIKGRAYGNTPLRERSVRHHTPLAPSFAVSNPLPPNVSMRHAMLLEHRYGNAIITNTLSAMRMI